MRPNTMKAQWLLVPGRARRRAELAAQARPDGMFFGPGRHDAEDGPTGHDPTRHHTLLPHLRQDIHGGVAVSQIRAKSPLPPIPRRRSAGGGVRRRQI
jgi:hypothetical protein